MSKTYPNEKECIQILNEAGCSSRVILHCRTVKEVADVISKNIPRADKDLVMAGALLHDLGRSRNHTILHAVIGAEMILELGLPKEVAEIVRRHTGAGLDDDDIEAFGLPQGDYFPRTIEQKIVSEADNLVSDSNLVSHLVPVEKLRKKDAPNGAERILALHKELSEEAGFDLDLIIEMIGETPVVDQLQRRRDQGRS
ncbi:MAG TPA: HDIG domain-containing protein [Candidatus Methanomethylophilaceae archaeon]|nr:HDIG domain-containing protein [Candidatus Methanomethylophilaceae archaeon]